MRLSKGLYSPHGNFCDRSEIFGLLRGKHGARWAAPGRETLVSEGPSRSQAGDIFTELPCRPHGSGYPNCSEGDTFNRQERATRENQPIRRQKAFRERTIGRLLKEEAVLPGLMLTLGRTKCHT
jgi:hypothetical protein